MPPEQVSTTPISRFWKEIENLPPLTASSGSARLSAFRLPVSLSKSKSRRAIRIDNSNPFTASCRPRVRPEIEDISFGQRTFNENLFCRSFIYRIRSGLDSEGKKEIKKLAESQGKQVNVIWPYDILSQSEIDQLGEKTKLEIFFRCKSHLNDADIMIALLDGPQVDDGTAWEIGYFCARKSPGQKIIGIRTDFRRAGESEGAVVNAMIECSCDWIVRSKEELLEKISQLF